MIKRIFAIALCACFALTLAACGCNSSNPENKGKTVISQVQEGDTANNNKPVKAVVHGRISGDAAPTGWAVKSDEGGDYITYVKGDDGNVENSDAYIQFGCDSISAEDLFKSAQNLNDTKGMGYSTDSVTIGDKLYFAIYPNEGQNSLFGTVNNGTLIINYKGVDINDPVVQKIISGIVIEPEK